MVYQREVEGDAQELCLPQQSLQLLRTCGPIQRQNNLISVLESYLIFSKVSQEERKRISQVFKQIDKNCDGEIEKTELIQAFKDHYPDATQGHTLEEI
jgi:Ca2+-binding EF-hand superfamily protein